MRQAQSLLAMDTSTEVFSISLQSEAGRTSRRVALGLRHGELLAHCVAAELDLHGIRAEDLDGILVSRGPGSFTGLRIGMATAKGIAAPWQIPILSLSVLEVWAALAQAAIPDATVLSLIDGRKKRYYYSLFAPGGQTILPTGDRPPKVILEETSASLKGFGTQKLLLTGTDAARFASEHGVEIAETLGGVSWRVLPDLDLPPAAEAMLSLGASRLAEGIADAQDMGPEYFRDSQAEESRRGSG